MERYTGPKSRQEILAEIEGWKANPPEGLPWQAELNNFYIYLPSDEYADRGGRQKAFLVSAAGLMDVKNSESHRDKNENSHHSNLYLSQTPREFFEEIDKTINSTPGVSLAEIKKLQHIHYQGGQLRLSERMSSKEERTELKRIEKSGKNLEKLCEYILPVYIELRVKGYSHFDLTG